MKLIIRSKGGPGSGHRGHKGRPGHVGGGLPGKGSVAKPSMSYEEWSRKQGYAPKHRSGKLTGKKFNVKGHDYEIIQSIPLMKDKSLIKFYGSPVGFIHAFDTTAQNDETFVVHDDGRVVGKSTKQEVNIPWGVDDL